MGSANELVVAITDDLISGADKWRKDARELMIALAPYHDCARRLGLDVAATFAEAATHCPDDLQTVTIEFGQRNDVTVAAFAWELVEGELGPEYLRNPRHDVDARDLERWLGP